MYCGHEDFRTTFLFLSGRNDTQREICKEIKRILYDSDSHIAVVKNYSSLCDSLFTCLKNCLFDFFTTTSASSLFFVVKAYLSILDHFTLTRRPSVHGLFINIDSRYLVCLLCLSVPSFFFCTPKLHPRASVTAEASGKPLT